jgi:hypothetical protein
MSGFAQIPKGSRGLCTNTFDFTGIQGQSYYSVALAGEREGPFTLSADPDVVSWSPCGGTSAIMNMNTQCNISPTREAALIAVRLSSSVFQTGGLPVASCRRQEWLLIMMNATGRSYQRQDHRQCFPRLAQVLNGCGCRTLKERVVVKTAAVFIYFSLARNPSTLCTPSSPIVDLQPLGFSCHGHCTPPFSEPEMIPPSPTSFPGAAWGQIINLRGKITLLPPGSRSIRWPM